MRWMETIRLQVGDGNRNKLEQTLAEIVQGACEGNMIEIKRYQHATVKGDWMIMLRWESDGVEPQGSRTGRSLAHLLKPCALVSHAVWVEEGRLEDQVPLTPALNDSILPGITRRSCIELAKSLGMEVEERRISIDELIEAGKTGRLSEVFGSGTAAVISPVGELKYAEQVITINNNKIGPVAQLFYDTITGIQKGTVADTLGWTTKV